MAVNQSTFEEGMKELESIVEKLEKGDAALEESISLFERGVSLTKELQKKLASAEKKVKLLVQSDGEMKETNFPEEF